MQMNRAKPGKLMDGEVEYRRRSKKTLVQVCKLPVVANFVARCFYLLSRICSFFLHEKSLPCNPENEHFAHDPLQKR